MIDIPEYLNHLLLFCFSSDVSDIHFEPHKKKGVVRIRKDGYLSIYEEIPIERFQSIINRIKILANINPGEKRIPQDSSISFEDEENNQNIDLRISTLFTINGEKLVIRLLRKEPKFKKIEELGMNQKIINQFKKRLIQTNGLIIVSGPTSSGKTTTLYAALQFLNKIDRNITTLEDPVEYKIEGINQVQVYPQVGLDFATGLRSILRQDPNVIMIGEIRDKETANIAVQAALTGHLILTSLHTNDAASAITRLLDMGIEPYLIASSVQMILSQRLVRKKCTCNRLTTCSKCNGIGYHGRFAVYELLEMDQNLHQSILSRASVHSIRAKMKEYHYPSMREELMIKVKEGTTTMEEFHRVMIDEEEMVIYES